MTSPLPHRDSSKIKHRWKMWRFERKAAKQRRARDAEFERFLRGNYRR